MSKWLPTVLELSWAGCKMPAARSVSELIGFLSEGPTPKQVASYKFLEPSQQRLRRLLALNQSSLLSEEEQAELEELEALQHIVSMLRIQAREQTVGKGN